MLKIMFAETTGESSTIRLEGRVIGPWVNELRLSCEAILATGSTLSLDLSDVSFVDRSGIELFKSLTKRQVVLANCSRFLTELLKA
jgi:anti-anti-sigma regulatory factor